MILAAVLLVAAGWIGVLVGDRFRHPGLGGVLGALAGLLVFLTRDATKAGRLLRWLRLAQDQPAPTTSGLWGEFAYRIERGFRLRDMAVRREDQRLRQFLSAIEASPNGVVLLDELDQIEWCNATASVHFGLDPERDQRQRITNLVRAPAFVAYLQADGSGEALHLPGSAVAPTLSIQLRPYGEGRRLLLTQDITERERSEAMRRDFVANVSHEIRTPLTVLAGFVETLQSLPLDADARQHVLALMQTQTDRMQSLVADLLTLARLEGSPRPDADRWHRLAGLLDQVVVDARALSAGSHRITLTCAPDVEVAGDRVELISAAGNLVTNAVRYTPKGGSVDVRFEITAAGIGILEVADSGIGIARDHIPRLTERFYRVDGSRSRETGGTGLGLAIVKHVAQRHGGEISVESEVGKGSRFHLSLPSARVRVSAPAGAPAVAAQLG